MSYKTILVHLDSSVRAHPRLETALQLAKRFDAHLIGLYAVFQPNARAFNVMAGSAGYCAAAQAVRSAMNCLLIDGELCGSRGWMLLAANAPE